jgi:hypothetical protein
MNARLVEIPPEVAVYLPFDAEEVNSPGQKTTGLGDMSLMLDFSINCWHLTPLYGAPISNVVSRAPVGRDASCVRHLDASMGVDENALGSKTRSSPSVAEYGEMQIGAFGSMEGSYKRVYSFIDSDGKWRLDTGFRIGSLITEWVSQVQTSPTLIGYIEGAPPIPAENYVREKDKPMSSIKFINSKMVQYMYGLRAEQGSDVAVSWGGGVGAEWKVSAGLGIQSQVSAGKVKAMYKGHFDLSSSQFNNNISTTKNHTNMDMKMELTSTWSEKKDEKKPAGVDGEYLPANTGMALVESEVADVFALRLKMRTGTAAPLVAYQMRPNPDIPKDRNLVSFPIDPKYTKQGCLNGYSGTEQDRDYMSKSDVPKDASYYKPVEAYALKERIRRAEEQLEGEYERYQITGKKSERDLPSRAHRNICNSYVWTAAGGTFQETHSTMDFIQQEVGGNSSSRLGHGFGFEMELSFLTPLIASNVDAMWTNHVNVMQTKDRQSENGFELQADLPAALDIRHPNPAKDKVLEKRVGAVDAYRWMSFWLEPSVEGTDAFFKQVVDFGWLEASADPAAVLLRELRSTLKHEPGNARTKAWRVFHRVTYVSRIGEEIKPKLDTSKQDDKKAGALLADISCNWLLLQYLEPLVRSATSKQQLKNLAEKPILNSYPAIRSDPIFYSQVLELLSDYVGLKD